MKRSLLIIPVLGLLAFALTRLTKEFQERTSDKIQADEHPGWQEDWQLMKIEDGKQIPEDLTARLYAQFHGRQANRNIVSNIENIKEIGPNSVAGRIRAFIIDWANTNRYLAAGVSGGLWESLDQGHSWTNLMPDGAFLNITGLTQSPFDPNTFYFSTGEAAGNSAGISGAGLFKSTDGGYTFDLLPGTEVTPFFRTWRIVHSRTDTNTFYVASPSGLFVSRDAGKFMDQLLFESCTDIEIHSNGEMYVGTDGDGIFYSSDGSDGSFGLVDQDLPFEYGRVELAISEENKNVIVAALEDVEEGTLGGIYYSQNKGQSWIELRNPRETILNTSFAWYCHTLLVHPEDPDFIIYGASDGAYTFDRGVQWQKLTDIHADIHSGQWNPENNLQVVMTSDGGLDRFERYMDFDLAFYENLNNGINITQFYTGAVFPNGDVIGGTQDNGTWFATKDGSNFDKIFGADGSYCAVNPQDSNDVYISYQRGNVYRLYPFYNNPSFNYISSIIQDSDDSQYFIAPFQLNKYNPSQLFHATRQRIWFSNDFGEFWSPLTEDISPYRVTPFLKNDTTSLFIGGSGASFYRINNLETHFSGDEIDLSGSVPNAVTSAFLRELVPHPTEDALFAVFSSFSDEDRVWKITDIFGESPIWHSVSGDLPEFVPANTIIVNPKNTDVMAVGTDFGLFTTRDAGDQWQLERDIPQTVIFQLTLHDDGTLNIFTHGRGIFSAKMRDFVNNKNEISHEKIFTVFPNPAMDRIRIANLEASEISRIGVYNIAGKCMRRITQPSENTIDVSGLVEGSYVLKVQLYDGRFASESFLKTVE